MCYGYSPNENCTTILVRTRYPLSDDFFLQNGVYEKLTSITQFNGITRNKSITFQVYSIILKNYIKPNDEIIHTVDSLLRGYNSRNLIGFHIRVSGKESDFKESAQFLYRSDLLRFINCSLIDYYKEPVIYVASDSSFAKQLIVNNTSHRVVFNNAIAIHTSSEIGKGNATTGVFGVLVDILALSRCQQIIGTKGSSLTYLAAAYQGDYPLYITRNTDCYYPMKLTTIIPR